MKTTAAAAPIPLRLKSLIPEFQFSKMIGLTRETLWKYRTLKRNPLPHTKIGGRIFYDAEAVNRWIDRCAVKAK